MSRSPLLPAAMAVAISLTIADAFAQANPATRGTNNFRVATQAHVATSIFETAVTGVSPFPAACGDLLGTVFPGAEVEPHVDVDPLNPNHLLGAWQQDRYSNGGARATAHGISFDGGFTWTRGALPLTGCSGGPYSRATDPWVAFAPDGTAYQMALALQNSGTTVSAVSSMVVSRSADGGLSWSAPIELSHSSNGFSDDKNTITADPHDARFVYAIWDRLRPNGGADTIFTRTTNGGASWEPARIIYAPVGQTISNLIRVLPNGTLVNMFVQLGGGAPPTIFVQRSTDRGETWSGPILVSISNALGARDPENGTVIRDATIVPQMAVAPNGTLYVVWQDARFTAQRDAIAISRSGDGGLTWTDPVRVNGDPGVTAFIPQVSVRADGTIGVTYYDFRSNTADPATLPTDFWIARSSDGVNWTETRVSQPFDFSRAPFANGLFVGDYTGLVSSGTTFIALYGKSGGDLQANRNDIYLARIPAAAALEAKRTYRAEGAPGFEPDDVFLERVMENAERALQARYWKLQRYTASSPGR